MIVLLSPTKTQKETKVGLELSKPTFYDESQSLVDVLKKFNLEEFKINMNLSDALASKTLEMYQSFDEKNRAIDTYQGAVFKALNAKDLDQTYLNDHLYIFSALYGILKPNDKISLYRLDYLSKLDFNLYDFWTEKISYHLNSINKTLINLASLEFSKTLNQDMLNNKIITIDFKEQVGDKYVSKSTYAKTARGTMAYLILKNKIKEPQLIKEIEFDDYQYNEELSTETHYIFSR